jgi:molybdopterin-guanine dinucleotide biosynthesis protein A
LSPARSVQSDVVGFMLAGGRSSRMGRDKALVDLGGQTLAARAIGLLQSAGLSAAIAGARSELADIAPVIPDQEQDQGPLSGICSALASTQAEFAVFISVDLPLLSASLLKFLVFHAQISGLAVTLGSVNGFSQTFPVVVRAEILPVLREELNAGRSGCFMAFRTAAARLNQEMNIIPVEIAVQSGHVSHPCALPPYQWFVNVNAPADLERARLAIA